LAAVNQWRSEGGGADRPGRQSGGGGKNSGDNGKNMEDNGHQASNDFLGRQDCSPHRAPITLTLRRYSLHYEFTTNDMS